MRCVLLGVLLLLVGCGGGGSQLSGPSPTSAGPGAGTTGVPAGLRFLSVPSPLPINTDFQVQVQAVDADGAPALQPVTVGLTLLSGPGGGTLTVVSSSSSGATTTFVVRVNLATPAGQPYRLSASGVGTPVTSSDILASGPATQLAFINSPRNGLTNQVIPGTPASPVTVEVRDAGGNRVWGDNGRTITVAVDAGPALTGGASALTVDGRATFPALMSANAGSYTVHAGSAPLADSAQATFGLSGVPTQLAFINSPDSTTAGLAVPGTPASPITVEVRDAGGNRVWTDNGRMLTLVSDPMVPALSSGFTSATTTGRATFAALICNTAGTYTIHAEATSLIPTPSTPPFTISP